MITQDYILQSRPAKDYWSLGGLPFFIHLTLQTWLLLTITCFDFSPITCMRKSSMMKVTSKRTFSVTSLWTFANAGSFLYQSVGDKLFISTEHISLKTSLMFKRIKIFKKTKEFSCQPNKYEWRHLYIYAYIYIYIYIYIYGNDQSDQIPKREFQHIGPIIHQNIMIFFINDSTHLVLTIHYYFDYLPCLKSMKVSVLLIFFSTMNFYQAYPCQ